MTLTMTMTMIVTPSVMQIFVQADQVHDYRTYFHTDMNSDNIMQIRESN
jgi:hypothetical protein